MFPPKNPIDIIMKKLGIIINLIKRANISSSIFYGTKKPLLA